MVLAREKEKKKVLARRDMEKKRRGINMKRYEKKRRRY